MGAQSDSTDNSGEGSALTVTITVTSSEKLAEVTYSVGEAGGDSEYRLPSSSDAIRFSFYNNRWGGTLTLTIPLNKNASGDNIYLNCKDTSGNIRTVTYSLF